MYPQYRTNYRLLDGPPRTTGPVSRDLAEAQYNRLKHRDDLVRAELHRQANEGAAWLVIDWHGVRLVDLDGEPTDPIGGFIPAREAV